MNNNLTESRTIDVAFITVNYNTRPLLEEMVTFFRAVPLPFSHSLTVVDNASTDGSLEFLDACPEVVTLRNRENLGYGRAMNQGIAASTSRYLCLLNTDVILNPEALAGLVDHCDSHPGVHVCSPVIRYPNGRVQGFFFKFGLVTLYLDLYKKICNKSFKVKLSSARTPLRVDGIAGAFIFCRRDIAADGRLFDEDFFFYYEDTELAHRLLKQGKRCEVLPRHSIIHIGGQSSSLRHIRLFYSSKYLYIRKQYGLRHAHIVFLLDRIKVLQKVCFYRCACFVTSSRNISNKRESYLHVIQALKEIKKRNVIRETDPAIIS